MANCSELGQCYGYLTLIIDVDQGQRHQHLKKSFWCTLEPSFKSVGEIPIEILPIVIFYFFFFWTFVINLWPWSWVWSRSLLLRLSNAPYSVFTFDLNVKFGSKGYEVWAHIYPISTLIMGQSHSQIHH